MPVPWLNPWFSWPLAFCQYCLEMQGAMLEGIAPHSRTGGRSAEEAVQSVSHNGQVIHVNFKR